MYSHVKVFFRSRISLSVASTGTEVSWKFQEEFYAFCVAKAMLWLHKMHKTLLRTFISVIITNFSVYVLAYFHHALGFCFGETLGLSFLNLNPFWYREKVSKTWAILWYCCSSSETSIPSNTKFNWYLGICISGSSLLLMINYSINDSQCTHL